MQARQTIGWNLRRLRVERGLSQERLGLAAEVDRAYVGRIERGSENVTITTLEALADALGVSALLREGRAGEDRPKPLKAGRRPKAKSPDRG